jgi:hypothetical protein
MRAYLVVVGLIALVGFGLPLLLAPLAWARAFRWTVADAPLARYLGRCLGAVACALAGVCAWTALRAAAPPPELVLVCAIAGVLLGAVHVVGALERAQPWTETAEIPLWLGLSAAGFVVYL